MRLTGKTLDYDVLDVFTATPFAGNPLAVVHGADGLSDAQLQAIAAQFNLSETAFPLPPTVAGADYRVRIFTPVTELPFAGLPSVGTALLLSARGRLPTGDVVQQAHAGLFPVRIKDGAAWLTGDTPVVGERLNATELAPAAGLTPSDVDTTLPAGVVGCGMHFTFLAVRPDALARAVPNADEIQGQVVGRGLVLVSFDPAERHARMRMFRVSGGEDAATGSAALALGVWLVDRGLVPADEETGFRISQGREMGRPSTLDCVVVASAGRAQRVVVGGHAVLTASGQIRVP
ncbi:PhzF family phenazine biosynthesis protein [Goodfellowiella coeruleoviolacea]|uniref:Trans-2,3-dihydro-3-hydroxyanthranilate isomerase n=1 Tax=Goodfellowiella coeruleoviolacea TaxID=334858 RepID=A0AAE3KEQ6_9PSEU|nr:PhzF family phenazine biosynthesis protein [Goodfellowiella coeruleoviolacea]MCP2165576.1 trans-2,3-dihydro-3-hydroxyanthranilate isomerase [Goodfellowiella coeruleoviolacea]